MKTTTATCVLLAGLTLAEPVLHHDHHQPAHSPGPDTLRCFGDEHPANPHAHDEVSPELTFDRGPRTEASGVAPTSRRW